MPSVYFDATKGRWVAKVTRKKEQAKAYAHSQEEAEALLPLLEAQLGLSTPDWTLEQAFEELLKGPLRDLTRAHYRDLYARYLAPWGSYKLSELTPRDAERLLARIPGSRTPSKVFALGHRLFRLAQKRGLPVENPFDRVQKPRYQAPKAPLWTLEELQRFLGALDGHRYGPLYLLLVLTGMRLGEALALDWREVDLERGEIRVVRTLGRRHGAWFWAPPKTPSGFRSLLLPPKAREALRSLGPRREGLVFQERGEPIPPWRVQHALKALCRTAQLPPLTPHQLRHLHASLLLKERLPVTEVAAHLGHASPEITLRVYAHLVPGNREVLEALERALSPPGPGSPPTGP